MAKNKNKLTPTSRKRSAQALFKRRGTIQCDKNFFLILEFIASQTAAPVFLQRFANAANIYLQLNLVPEWSCLVSLRGGHLLYNLPAAVYNLHIHFIDYYFAKQVLCNLT